MFLWHGLCPRFGLGEERGLVDRRAAVVTLRLLLIVVVAGVLGGSRSFLSELP